MQRERFASSGEELPELTDRQQQVLRAVVAAFIGSAAPVGSDTVSHLLAVRLSSASIRNTMAELSSLGLIAKAHASSGRVPTARGLRLFVDDLLSPLELGRYERRELQRSFDGARGGGVVQLASQLLSDRTRQLGFVMTPRIERIGLRHVSLVRLSSDRMLAVLVSESGETHQRVVEDAGVASQAELDRMASALNERIAGRTLAELRARLLREGREIALHADDLVKRAVAIGLRVIGVERDAFDPTDLVVASRLALLEQPEFSNAERVRELFGALETNAALLALLDRMIDDPRVQVSIGEDLDDAELHGCALVAAPYRAGASGMPVGVLGVIGPNRMDYSRIIPLVGYCSQLVTEKLRA